jgi:hypothetical protein
MIKVEALTMVVRLVGNSNDGRTNIKTQIGSAQRRKVIVD